MKKFILGIIVSCMVFGGMCLPSMAASVGDYELKISGSLDVLGKISRDYYTPLDSGGSSTRGGANYRNHQHFRGVGRLNMYFGDPGKTEWFGFGQIKFDAHDPDSPSTASGVAWDDEQKTWAASFTPSGEYTENYVEGEMILIMWRPFELMGGRPLGITMGRLSYKQTINALYSHRFMGDYEDDFILYSASALYNVPGINIDFHIDADTGFGFGYCTGIKDGSEIGALMNIESADNYVGYLEAKKFGFTLNAAAQFIDGHFVGDYGTGRVITPRENEYNRYNRDDTDKHTLANGQLSYTLDLSGIFDGFKIMPYAAITRIWGDEAQADSLKSMGYEPREIDGSAYVGGLKIFHNLFGMPAEFVTQYSHVATDEINGINALPKGTINRELVAAWDTVATGVKALASDPTVAQTLQGLYALYGNDPQALSMALDSAATQMSAATGQDISGEALGLALLSYSSDFEDYTWSTKGLSTVGTSESTLVLSDMDFTVHAEYNIHVNKNIKLGFFYYWLEGHGDDSLKADNSELIAEQLKEGMVDRLTSETDLDAANAGTIVDGILASEDGVATIDAINANLIRFEWTDTYSYGLFVSYQF